MSNRIPSCRVGVLAHRVFRKHQNGGRERPPYVRRRGFTLVEVLATLLLVGIVLPAVMEGISLAQQTGRLARTKLEAAALAEAKLNEIVAGGQSSASSGSGDFGEDRPGYRWEVQVVERDYSVSEIAVRVTWTVRAAERSVTVSTLVYNLPDSTSGASTGSTQ